MEQKAKKHKTARSEGEKMKIKLKRVLTGIICASMLVTSTWSTDIGVVHAEETQSAENTDGSENNKGKQDADANTSTSVGASEEQKKTDEDSDKNVSGTSSTQTDTSKVTGTEEKKDTAAETVTDNKATGKETETGTLTETVTTTETETETTETETTETETTTETQEKKEYPSVDFGSFDAGDMTVAISAPEGAFPKGTTVTVTPVSVSNDVEKDVKDQAEGQGKKVDTMMAADITFYDEGGKEIQPLVPISVTFSSKEMKGAIAEVYHVSDDNDVELKGKQDSTSDTSLTVDVKNFSVYVCALTVLGTSIKYKIRYHYTAGDNDSDTKTVDLVCDGDKANDNTSGTDLKAIHLSDGKFDGKSIMKDEHTGYILQGWSKSDKADKADYALGETVDLSGATFTNENGIRYLDIYAVYVEGKEMAVNDYIDKSSFRFKINGSDASPDGTTDIYDNKDNTVDIGFSWTIPNSTRTPGDSFSYDFPVGISFDKCLSGDIQNGNVPVGTYKIDTVNKGIKGQQFARVTFTYFDSFLSNSNITGTFDISGKINLSIIETDKDDVSTISFPGVGDYKVKVNKVATVGVQKTFVDKDKFLITVTSTGNNKDVSVDDTMGEYLSLKAGSTPVIGKSYTTNESGSAVSDVLAENEYSYSTKDNGFSYKISNMTAGEKIYIFYDVDLADGARYDKDTSAEEKRKNTVSAKSSQMDKAVEAQATYAMGAEDYKISKTGKAHTKDGTNDWVVDWTITIKPYDGYVTLKDTLGDNLNMPTGIKETLGSGSSATYNENAVKDLMNGTYVVKNVKDGAVITYSTDVVIPKGSDLLKQQTRTNTITGTFGDHKLSADASVTFGYNYDGWDNINKGVVDKTHTLNGNEITWKIKIQIPKKSTDDTADFVLSDLYIVDGYADGFESMKEDTSGDIHDLGDRTDLTISYSDSDGKNPTTIGSSDYTVKSDDSATVSGYDKDKVKGRFRIDFEKDIMSSLVGKTITVTYKNVMNTTDVFNNIVYRNDASVYINGAVRHDWEDVSYYGAILSKSGAGADNKGLMTWKIETSALGSDGAQISDNWGDQKLSFVPGSMLLYRNGTDITGSVGDAGEYLTVTDNGFTVKITDKIKNAVGSGKLTIKYKTRIAEAANTDKVWYKNYATLVDSTMNYGTVMGSQVVSLDGVLTKERDYDTGSVVKYKVQVNPDALKLVKDNSGKLILEDTIGSALDFQMSSICVNGTSIGELSKGNAAYGYSYDNVSRKLTITIPDETAATITYNAIFNKVPGTEFAGDEACNNIALTNSVFGSISAKSMKITKVIASNATSTGSGKMIIVNKYGDNKTSNMLSGVEFKTEIVGTIDKTSGAFVPVESGKSEPKTFTTEKDGTASISGYKADMIYKLVETKAASGYNADVTPRFFVFEGSDGITYPQSIEVDGKTYDLDVKKTEDVSDSFWINNNKTVVPPTPPTPPTPTPTPDNPVTPNASSDSGSPVAAVASGNVLGARRDPVSESGTSAAEESKGVLGARRTAGTGDNANIFKWIMTFIISGAAGAALIAFKKKFGLKDNK